MKKIEETHKYWEPDYDSQAAKLETDKNLLTKAINTLAANESINSEGITVRVADRIVFLEGSVQQRKERISAQKCIRDIFGIRAVINYLTYKSEYAHN